MVGVGVGVGVDCVYLGWLGVEWRAGEVTASSLFQTQTPLWFDPFVPSHDDPFHSSALWPTRHNRKTRATRADCTSPGTS